MVTTEIGALVRILLVEDSPADVVLTREALRGSRLNSQISVVGDGVEALEYLRRDGRFQHAPPVDLVLLDLNLPRMDGREVLEALAADPELSRIPVVVLTTSRAPHDVNFAYTTKANCYVTKPLDLDEFTEAVRKIEEFWFETATLPEPPTVGATGAA